MKIDIKKKYSFSIDWFTAVLIVIFLLRLYIAKGIPVFSIVSGQHDDLWYFEHASSILKGQWLGTYSEMTLIKGITYSLFLVLTYVSEIPYSILLALLQEITALLFVRAVKPLLPNRYLRGVLMIIMIFLPVTMGFPTGQRIYRNALSWPLTLAVITGFIAVFLRVGKRPSAAWYVYAGTALVLFVNLREDSIWLYPFIGCAVILTVVFFLAGKK